MDYLLSKKMSETSENAAKTDILQLQSPKEESHNKAIEALLMNSLEDAGEFSLENLTNDESEKDKKQLKKN